MSEQPDGVHVPADDMPVDPDAQAYSDDEEGADELGLPVTSIDGSEDPDA